VESAKKVKVLVAGMDTGWIRVNPKLQDGERRIEPWCRRNFKDTVVRKQEGAPKTMGACLNEAKEPVRLAKAI